MPSKWCPDGSDTYRFIKSVDVLSSSFCVKALNWTQKVQTFFISSLQPTTVEANSILVWSDDVESSAALLYTPLATYASAVKNSKSFSNSVCYLCIYLAINLDLFGVPIFFRNEHLPFLSYKACNDPPPNSCTSPGLTHIFSQTFPDITYIISFNLPLSLWLLFLALLSL